MEENDRGEAVLRARGVSVVYMRGTPFETWALEELSLDVHPGEFLGIVGGTGSGKSTLIQTLAGLLPVERGELEGVVSLRSDSPGSRIGLVFQQPEDQIFERTVHDEIAFGPRQLGVAEEDIPRRVETSLLAMGLAPDRVAGRSPFELSGGEKRRVAIASILAMEPDVLILDEPTAGLDHRGRAALLALLNRFHETGEKTILVVSHDMDFLAQAAHRIAVLSEGRLLALGPPDEVYTDSAMLRRAGLESPALTSLVARLKERGVDLAVEGIPDVENVVQAIREMKGGVE